MPLTMNNTPRRTPKQADFYRMLLESSSATVDPNTFHQSVEQELRFVTFKTRNGSVIDVVVRANGKKTARVQAQQLVESGELCSGLKFVEVS